jgi:MFS family permease
MIPKMKLTGSPFVWVSFAMAVGVMSTALISPLYPLYKEAWHLIPSDVSMIYVIYMIGALCGLLFLGRLPEKLGFRRVMMWALVFAVVGSLMSVFAWDMVSMSVARFIVGISSTMMTTAASKGLSALAPPGSIRKTAMITGFLIAFGFGLGPLLGGVMGQWLPYPLVLPYIPNIILGLVGLYALYCLAVPTHLTESAEGRGDFKVQDCLPKLTWTTPADSQAFAITTGLPFLSFATFGLYASMAPLFLDKMVPWHGPIVSGGTLAVILLLSAGVQITAGRLATRVCGFWGLNALVGSSVLMMINLWLSSSVLFALGVLFTACGHGMCMISGMSMVNRISQPHNRSGLLSTYLLIGYVGTIVPLLAMGWIADHWGLSVSVIAFCSMIAILSGLIGTWFYRHPRMHFTSD